MGQFNICMGFKRRFKMVEEEPPEDVKEAFRKYAEGGSDMTVDQLKLFLTEVQGEDGDAAEAILRDTLQERHLIRDTLNIDDFYFYLFSGDLNPPFIQKVHHEMSAPLSHYFIFTGHNSYLKGNQLTGKCSVVPIEKALKNGVRVIELDLWPNKDDINVLHGGTATSPVKLINCLESIRDHAFLENPYPVIITLEDHLTPELQKKVAVMLKQTFGPMLYRPKLECLEEFPCPDELRNKIVISTKHPKKLPESKQKSSKTRKNLHDYLIDDWDNKQSDYDQDFEDDEDFAIPKKNPMWRFCFLQNRRDSIRRDDSLDYDEDDDYDEQGSPAMEYKSIITIPSGKPKGGLLKALQVDPEFVRRLSLSEQGIQRAIERYGEDVLRFTTRNILRVYPKGTRVNSSNYNPLKAWMHGAQMVAFNMQGYGRSLWLMQGMFRANGGCGYVKKPDFLMNIDPTIGHFFNPKAKLPVKKILKVKVYKGDGWHSDFKRTHFDFFSPPDFYARIGIAGVFCDVKKEKTRTIANKWIPIWDEEFEFPLSVPELALLRIEVKERDVADKNDFGGQTCLPVSELRSGIRAIPLHNRKGEKYKHVRLLMRFQFVN